MKLVFTASELAEALQISADEFRERRPVLEAHGFPRPLPNLSERWSIMDVVNWVNGATRQRHDDGSASPAGAPAPRLS